MAEAGAEGYELVVGRHLAELDNASWKRGLKLLWFGTGKDDGRDPYERLSDEANKIPAGSEGLFWAPYLMGERTPYLDPNVRAGLVGLSPSHTRAHIVRAIQEGVAFSLKDTFSIFEEMQVPVTKIRLGGGGARSKVWRQIQADVYAHEVELVEAEEGAAYGAAILAAVGARHWNSVDEACDTVVRVATKVAPRTDASRTMQKSYSVYRRIYPALRSINTSTEIK
jgi:xylulokinase